MTEPGYGNSLAEALLQIKAIRLSPQKPFTWASGLLSPVYCDNRLLLSYPELRNIAILGLEALAGEFPSIQAIAGVATAGIPHGAILADRLGLPFLYVRSKPKDHGRGNLIEGEVPQGKRVLVVEDLISTGGSALQAAEALSAAGAEVVAVVALFSYGFPTTRDRFHTAGLPLRTVASYEDILDVSRRTARFSEEDLRLLSTWHTDPKNWSAQATSSVS